MGFNRTTLPDLDVRIAFANATPGAACGEDDAGFV